MAKVDSGLGQQAEDFELSAGRRLTDETARAWSDAQDYWHIFQRRSSTLPENETGATLTRRWVSHLLEVVGYEIALQQAGVVIGEKNYPISHRAGASEDSPPVQIEGFRTDLDKRPQARRLSPQALVQEYLNNCDAQLWGIVTNGYLLRLLRDTSRTSRPSYLEFDLQSILEGNRFNEFVLFYRVCHRTRLPRTAEEATSCWLEKYFQLSIEQGGRVRDKLRDGVEDALKTLGTGFLRHPENSALQERVKTGTLTAAEFHRQLLRLVYRLLFLMVAEERCMIVPEGPEADRRQSLYDRYYSVGRLRTLAEKPVEASTFGDLWLGLQQTFALFEDGDSNPLGIPPLNGDLFSAVAVKDVQGTHLYNDVLLAAMQRLSLFEDHRVHQRVNYSALDVEELGSVYESLLDFHPAFTEHADGFIFDLRTGSERKSTGSYYTRPELVRELIESALVPVMQDRLSAVKDADSAKEKEKKQKAILSMSACDPACGSGHFLLAAARRLGRELAKVRTGEDEPIPRELHLAVRDVIAHCIYGVDVNPLAVDLCKLALWLEGHWTGKPLTFLDHRIKCGNSLVGVIEPTVLEEGVPDEAYTAVTGDVKAAASAYKRENKQARERLERSRNQGRLRLNVGEGLHVLAHGAREISAVMEETPTDVRQKAQRYAALRDTSDFNQELLASNLWTSAFFAELKESTDKRIPTTEELERCLEKLPVNGITLGYAFDLASQGRFFHWKLEFPEVFDSGGFDVVLGNPPWERIKLQEQEFFGARSDEIATAQNKAARGLLIKALFEPDASDSQRQLALEWNSAKHVAEATSKFVRSSGRYPLTGVGDINVYAPFAETFLTILNASGRGGIIIPSGVATDHTTRDFFGHLIGKHILDRFFEFENEGFFSAGQGHMVRFALTTLAKKGDVQSTDFVFQATTVEELRFPQRHFQLTSEEIKLLNPNTLTCPIFRTQADAALTKAIYKRIPVFVNESKGEAGDPWRVQFMAMFHMANDSPLFRTVADFGKNNGQRLGGNWIDSGEQYVRLFEAKMVQTYNHRHGDFADAEEGERIHRLPEISVERLSDPNYVVSPFYWVPRSEVESRLRDKGWAKKWLIGWRDVTDARASERTVVAAAIPRVGVGDKFLLMLPEANTRLCMALLANLCTLTLDYVARQKVGGIALKYFTMKQLPLLAPTEYKPEDLEFIVPRVLELSYTANDMRSLGQDLEYEGSPFVWNEDKRHHIRAELDGYYAHLYRLTREELRYILDPKNVFGSDYPSETFRILKERDERKFAEYRTQRLVLEAFDSLSESPRFRDEMPKRKSAFSLPEKTLASVGN
ncbi:MAG: restriction endonuclease [Acidobacteria bacterium]|nr:MAG: restriction endonuclease [Acidobacteriota bacterium]